LGATRRYTVSQAPSLRSCAIRPCGVRRSCRHSNGVDERMPKRSEVPQVVVRPQVRLSRGSSTLSEQPSI
jgi:hypothetical protein